MKKLLTLITAALLLPSTSFAAIAYDAVSAAATNSGVTSLTGAHTFTGTDKGVIICTSYLGQDRTVSSVTVNGVAATAIYANQNFAGAYYFGMYFLANPTTGDIVVNMSGTTANRLAYFATSYTGVSQTGQPDANSIELSSASVASRTQNVTTVADNDWLVGCVSSGDTLSAGANTTIRNSQPSPFDLAVRIFDSNGAKTPPGSHGLTINVSPNNSLPMIVAALKPAVAAPYVPNFGDFILFD